MFISAREASRILGEEAGVARQQARRVLLAGLALRLGRGSEPTPEWSWAERVRRLRRQPGVGAMARIQARVRIEKGSGSLGGRRLVTSPGPPWLLLGEQPYAKRSARPDART